MNHLRAFLFPVFFFGMLICAHAQQRPNILIVLSDDHAYQAISAYGSRLTQTPGIDRIAHEGVIFNKAYVTNSICGPSRAVILTSKYSHKNGFRDNNHPVFDGSQNSFVKELSKSGYQTAWVGKWHLGTMPRGFNYWEILPDQGEYYNPDFIQMDSSVKRKEGYVTNIIQGLAEDWLDKRDTSKPFCLVIGHKATHRNWLPDTADMGRFREIKFPLPGNFFDNYTGRPAAAVQDMTIDKTMLPGYDLKMFESDSAANSWNSISRMNAAQRKKFDAWYKPISKNYFDQKLSDKERVELKYQLYMQDYLSTATSLDRNIERMLAYLDKHDLANNTIVVYLSDQGFYLGEHGWFDKRWMYEESFRTPMVMRYPGKIRPGTINDNFVMNLDMGPTLLEAAGVAIPSDMEGESFLPLVTGKKKAGRKSMYYHYYENGIHSVSPHFGIRTARYKLIRYYEKVDGWELFDLEKDSGEMHNLYGRRGYEKITASLKKELEQLIRKYGDDEAIEILHGNK